MILLYLYMAAVAIVLSGAALIEYQGLKQNVSGANGFIWTMVSLFMAMVLLPTSALSWFFFDGRTALGTLVLGGGWLALVGWATMKLMMAGARKS